MGRFLFWMFAPHTRVVGRFMDVVCFLFCSSLVKLPFQNGTPTRWKGSSTIVSVSLGFAVILVYSSVSCDYIWQFRNSCYCEIMIAFVIEYVVM